MTTWLITEYMAYRRGRRGLMMTTWLIAEVDEASWWLHGLLPRKTGPHDDYMAYCRGRRGLMMTTWLIADEDVASWWLHDLLPRKTWLHDDYLAYCLRRRGFMIITCCLQLQRRGFIFILDVAYCSLVVSYWITRHWNISNFFLIHLDVGPWSVWL